MTTDREKMQEALKRIVVPAIRTLGFKGSFPHFKRRAEGEHQMLMLCFNKYGGSFYLEAGRISDQRVRELQQLWADAGKSLTEASLTVGHCNLNQRARLGPNGFLSDKDHWFVFGPDNASSGGYPQQSAGSLDAIATQVATWLKQYAAPFFGSAP